MLNEIAVLVEVEYNLVEEFYLYFLWFPAGMFVFP